MLYWPDLFRIWLTASPPDVRVRLCLQENHLTSGGRAARAIRGLDRHQGREFLAAAAILQALSANSLECASTSMTCLASYRPEHRPRPEVGPPQDICSST